MQLRVPYREFRYQEGTGYHHAGRAGGCVRGFLALAFEMARKPNYNLAKRQKELAREQKRDAKLQEKRERKEAERLSAEQDPANPGPGEPPAD
jgi:hypothetical protein